MPIGKQSDNDHLTTAIGHRRRSVLVTLMTLLLVACTTNAKIFAQQPNESPADTTSSERLIVGIEGFYRVGHWTGVRHTQHQHVKSITTRDGDGVEVRYTQPKTNQRTQWAYVIPGSEAAPLIAELESGDLIASRFPSRASPSRGSSMIPLSMPWIVTIGDPLGIDELGANKLLDRGASVAVSQPQTGAALPDSTLGYSGVDLIMINASGGDLLRQLNPNQQEAIVRWVESGGRLLLTLGASAPTLLKESSWLQDLLPITEIKIAELDPSAFETYTSSQTPLSPFDGLLLPNSSGTKLLLGRTTRRQNAPIASQYNLGLGSVIAISADLEKPMFADWPERMDLITQLLGDTLNPKGELPAQNTRSTAYDDLAGQLRTTLDQFEVKNRYSFSLLSLILLSLLALIGPLDFLLLNRLLGKPILGWLSFPIATIGISLFLIYESRPLALLKSDSQIDIPKIQSATDSENSSLPVEQQWNRLEIIDVDTTIDKGFVRSIHYLYSHRAQLADIDVSSSASLKRIGSTMRSHLTTPFGYPGESFGGIQIGIEDSRLPTYSMNLDDKLRSASIGGMPIASRSSRGVYSCMEFAPNLVNQDSISRRSGSELLQGKLANPLDVDILDGMLIYGNWIYVLPTRFPAGSLIESLDALRQKNFRWHLSRQKALGSSSETEAWNPSETAELDRVGEMLLFHRAAGGTRYTTLNNGPLSDLDLSHVLTDERCILFGQLKDAATTLQNDESSELNAEGKRETFIRVILPVKNLREK